MAFIFLRLLKTFDLSLISPLINFILLFNLKSLFKLPLELLSKTVTLCPLLTNNSQILDPINPVPTETKKLLLEQKIFQGFQGYNTLKKSELEFSRANFSLKNMQQKTILDAASVYFDLNYRSKTKKFNLLNVDLFERQVESDNARVQKGEITLTDLAQSESSLAGAKASFISSDTNDCCTVLYGFVQFCIVL